MIAHWNGSTWQRTSVASLPPHRSSYCGPAIDGIYGLSASDSWAVGSAQCQDIAGPSVLLHCAGGSWHRVARLGDHVPVGVLPDGRGGLWIPVDGEHTPQGAILHFSRGTVTTAPLPVSGDQLFLFGVTVTAKGTTALAFGRRTLRPSLVTTGVILRCQG